MIVFEVKINFDIHDHIDFLMKTVKNIPKISKMSVNLCSKC